jgi:hypothetical protein
VNLIENFIEKNDGLLDTAKTSETQEVTVDDFVLNQVYTKTNQGALVWASRRKGSFHIQ